MNVMSNPPIIPVVLTSLMMGSSVFLGIKLRNIPIQNINTKMGMNILHSSTIRLSIVEVSSNSCGVKCSTLNANSNSATMIHMPVIMVNIAIILIRVFNFIFFVSLFIVCVVFYIPINYCS